MARLHRPKYLVKRGDFYYFRIAVPSSLRQRLGCNEFKVSLRTDSSYKARQICRSLGNQFENYFKVIPVMNELNQDQLRAIAQSYFRELLIADNDRIFWIEEMWGNDPDDRSEAAEGAGLRHAKLVEQDLSGDNLAHFSGIVEQKLLAAGHAQITQTSESFDLLRRYFLRAEIERQKIFRAKLLKNYSGTSPTDPLYVGIIDDSLPPLTGDGMPASSNITLETAAMKFIAIKQNSWAYKSKLDFERVLKWLKEHVNGKRDIRTISTLDIASFRDLLLTIPKNYNKKKGDEKLTLTDAIKLLGTENVIAPQTAEKYLNMAKTFFTWCEAEEYIPKVPGQKIGIDYKMSEQARFPFDEAQLSAIFTSPIWAGSSSRSQRSKPGSNIYLNAYWWIPLIGAYTGMRGGEIVQLRHKDIAEAVGIRYFDVNDQNDKKIKTKASRRKVPLHPLLIEWGLLDFIGSRYKGNTEDRIFNEISISAKGDPMNAYSKSFSRYLRDIGVKNPKLSFHSFRHTVTDALDNAGVPLTHRRAITGHSDSSTSEQYGVGPSVPVLFEAIRKISYSFEKTLSPAPLGRNIYTGQ